MNISTPDPLYLIAIGASAGGMEDIHLFFDHTPLDGVSYIIIQHLSPDFKSRMVELLTKHSKLKVTEAEENMPVESNQVYFIPNKKFMTISEGKLHLTEKEKNSTPKLTINVFLNSLAAERGKNAIAVILSGMGSDGSEGIKAIKRAGGLVIARNPEGAEFGDMPANAIAAGAVDYVLDTEMMPQAITDYVKNKGVLLPEMTEKKDEKKVVAAIVDLISDNLSLDFSQYKTATILRRIQRKAVYLNFTKLESYLAFLKTNSDEVKALAHDFLISVTSFFRDKESFGYLQNNIIPSILKQHKPGEEIKCWVAGCATGEEAYTLAILLCEQLRGEYKDVSVKIFATDIDAAALTHARKGLYNESITKDVLPERTERFFVKEGNNYRIKPEIRKMIIFAEHDLVKNPPYCNVNFISCRNLLIYMTPVLQKKVFSMLHFGLKDDGYLFLGASENIPSHSLGLRVINDKYKIYKNTEAKRSDIFGSFANPALLTIKTPATTGAANNYNYKRGNLSENVYNALISDTGETVVCIDENNEVIQTFGDTTKYLLQKNFTANLEELLPKPLGIAFNKAKRKALQSNEKAAVKGIKVKINESVLLVNLQVKLLPVNKGDQKILYVLFSSEADTTFLPQENICSDDEKAWINDYTTSLEEELREVKEQLQTANEKLNASYENMQSFNEELLSGNEEMQSLIEELHTINADYQLKNKELIEINDDLNNYFNSNQNGQLFVNRDLLLTKFSPAAVKHINLLETDIGRPISNISTNIKFETIVSDLREVIAKGGVITKEVEALNGKWYQVMTMPFIRLLDNKTDGAIITFNDITELKKTQNDLLITNKNLTRINADLDNFVLAASHDLLGPLSNIEISIDMLKEDNLISDPLVYDYLNIVENSVKKFRVLINELSAIGKIESEMSEMKPVDLDEIIDEIKLSIADKIQSAGAEIITDLKVKQVYFSKKNLRSILYNVITNAIKYKSAQRDPVLVISTAKGKNYVLLSIKDNGIGIAKDKIDEIFNIYGRIQNNVEGQGIGLYLAKKITDAAGGYISVESEVGKGSVFNIYFKIEQ